MRKQSGFTLVEALVSMLVMAVGLLGLAGITVVVLRSNTTSQQISDATTIAADLMDTLKRQPLTSIPDCDDSAAYNTLSVPANCSILVQSGFAGLSSSSLPSLPPLNNSSTNASGVACSIGNVLGSSNTATMFDVVGSNLQEVYGFGSSDSLCNETNITLPPKSYIRFYRTKYTGTLSSSDRTIFVGVLFKNKFGKWMGKYLSTTRTQ